MAGESYTCNKYIVTTMAKLYSKGSKYLSFGKEHGDEKAYYLRSIKEYIRSFNIHRYNRGD